MPRRSFENPSPVKTGLTDLHTGKELEIPGIPVICANIRRLRLAAGMEQKELADRLGVSKNSASNWETGRARPDIYHIPMICSIFSVTPYELLGMEEPGEKYTPREERHILQYRSLKDGHKYVVDALVSSLQELEEAEAEPPELIALPYPAKALAAGIGDPTEYYDEAETVYVYASPLTRRADLLCRVCGDSMEPSFHHGDRVLVERVPDAGYMHYGEIGAFVVDNEFYLKQYEADGLHSLNPRYAPMHFDEELTTVLLIGRVLGVLEEEQEASAKDIRRFLMNSSEGKP